MPAPALPKSERVDFRALKAGAQRLPFGHPLRDAILAAPDELRRDEAAPALEVIIRLAWVHRRHDGP